MSRKYFSQFVMSFDFFFFFLNSWSRGYRSPLWWLLRNDLHCNARGAPFLSPHVVKQSSERIPKHHEVWFQGQILLEKPVSQRWAKRLKVTSLLSSHHPIERRTGASMTGWMQSGFEFQWKDPRSSSIALPFCRASMKTVLSVGGMLRPRGTNKSRFGH